MDKTRKKNKVPPLKILQLGTKNKYDDQMPYYRLTSLNYNGRILRLSVDWVRLRQAFIKLELLQGRSYADGYQFPLKEKYVYGKNTGFCHGYLESSIDKMFYRRNDPMGLYCMRIEIYGKHPETNQDVVLEIADIDLVLPETKYRYILPRCAFAAIVMILGVMTHL